MRKNFSRQRKRKACSKFQYSSQFLPSTLRFVQASVRESCKTGDGVAKLRHGTNEYLDSTRALIEIKQFENKSSVHWAVTLRCTKPENKLSHSSSNFNFTRRTLTLTRLQIDTTRNPRGRYTKTEERGKYGGGRGEGRGRAISTNDEGQKKGGRGGREGPRRVREAVICNETQQLQSESMHGVSACRVNAPYCSWAAAEK